ncbi:MAG: metallophosphoesterase [Hyphomicrobiaceae bacterium]
MSDVFTLAHLSDIHLPPLPRLHLRHANLKRILGFLNWHRGRKHAHLVGTLAEIVMDLELQMPDHVAVTGDLANVGTPAEFVAATDWLKTLGAPSHVSVVPGNHDLYTRLRNDIGIGRWGAYMTPNAAGAALSAPAAMVFPFVRRFGDVALVGINSAKPTRPFYAGGRVGGDQLLGLAHVLQTLGQRGVFRVVLIHHPPLPGLARPSKALEDAAEVEHVLTTHGAELVLYGHNHVSRISYRHHATGDGVMAVVGVPSASVGRPHGHDMLARYHLFNIEADAGLGPRVELVARGLAAPGGPVMEIERRTILPARPPEA